MNNPLLNNGRVLFVRNNCPYCKKWKKFIYRINMELKLNKRIKIVDGTNHYEHGIVDNPLIELFDSHFEEYPCLFFEGERKERAKSSIECEAWLISRLILEGDFIFPRTPEFLEELGRYNIFNQDCKLKGGQVICIEK